MELRISDRLAAFLIEKLDAENLDLKTAHDEVVEILNKNEQTHKEALRSLAEASNQLAIERDEARKKLAEAIAENKELNMQLAFLKAKSDVENKTDEPGKRGRKPKEA